MKKYLSINLGDRFNGTIAIKQTEEDETVIQTDLAESIKLTEDPGELNLQLGRRHRGCLIPYVTDQGNIRLRFRPDQKGVATAKETNETLSTTEHGRIYKNSRMTRIIFEFPVSTSFSQISDALDDECYELREFLERES